MCFCWCFSVDMFVCEWNSVQSLVSPSAKDRGKRNGGWNCTLCVRFSLCV